MLIGRLMTDGRLNTCVKCDPTENLALKINAQLTSEPHYSQGMFNFDYKVRLKNDHLNVAKFEPDIGLDPVLDLILVGSEWQFKILSRASMWQDNLVVTSTCSVDQDVLSPSELAESPVEVDGKLAFKNLVTTTLETLMPRIEGKGEFGQALLRLVYAPRFPCLLSVHPMTDPLKSLANNISLATEVEVQLGKRLQS